MCGIFAYTGQRDAAPLIRDGLGLLEYRGYDSAGVAVVQDGTLQLRKRVGRIGELAGLLARQPVAGHCGIGHTRWATHGGVSERNAHPHIGGNNLVAVAHNGIIENHLALRHELEAAGVVFRSETDTEVIAHLIAQYYHGDLIEAVRKALRRLSGTYGLAIVSPAHPGMVLGARLGSPLVLGVGRGEHYLASDPAALVGHTRQVVYLDDGRLCVLSPSDWSLYDLDRAPVTGTVEEIDWRPDAADKGGFAHFMLKEIYEQPEALENTLRGRLDDANATAKFGGLNLDPRTLRRVRRVLYTACGTSYYAALVGEYLLEALAELPAEVEYGSEFRYRTPPMDRRSILVALTQSGETADTLAAVREAKRKGVPTLGITNVVGSTVAREVRGGIYLHAGPEIGVASTKAFTAQLAVLTLLALYFGRLRPLTSSTGARMLAEIRALPDLVRRVLKCHEAVRGVAQKYVQCTNFLYLGRHYLYPVALEGALKLKELSYLHAEGYPAGEMKHGPIALVDRHTPSVFLAPRNGVYDKMMSNLEEVRARGGPVIALATEGDDQVASRADDVLWIPDVPEYLQPIIAVVPLQLLAYEIARLRGCDIDKPRNLAKSVTVE